MKNKMALAVCAGLAGAIGARAAWRAFRRYDLRDKVVLVTGGSRGLGLLLCREFARTGAKVATCARDAVELQSAAVILAKEGIDLFTHVCDVRDQAQVQDLLTAVDSKFGRVDVLINNAGVIEVGPASEMTLEDYRDAMNTHFWGPLYTSLAVLPQMRSRNDGRIVNISSIGGKIPVPHLAPYSASKFALVGLSEALRAELLPKGIVVTTVCPGLMRTGSPENAQFKGQNTKEYAWFTLSDSLPVLSMSADAAARQIVNACRHGDAEVVLSLPMKVAAKLYGLAPNLAATALQIAGAALPAPGGIGTEKVSGRESHTPLTESGLTALTQKAARDNNELREPMAAGT